MKKILFLFTLIILSKSILCQNNIQLFNYIVNYELRSKSNTNQKDYNIENYVLFINKSTSLFRPTWFSILDTMQLTKEYNNLSQQQQIILGLKY
ncbi:MAG: hypothetical protein ACK5NK_06700 [Niabella sp.]